MYSLTGLTISNVTREQNAYNCCTRHTYTYYILYGYIILRFRTINLRVKSTEWSASAIGRRDDTYYTRKINHSGDVHVCIIHTIKYIRYIHRHAQNDVRL